LGKGGKYTQKKFLGGYQEEDLEKKFLNPVQKLFTRICYSFPEKIGDVARFNNFRHVWYWYVICNLTTNRWTQDVGGFSVGQNTISQMVTLRFHRLRH